MKIAELKNKKIAILGMGIEGKATAEYFTSHGIRFSALDEKIDGPFTVEQLSQFDVVVRSPGISPLRQVLINAVEQGIEITSQMDIFFDNCPSKIVGVTGTKGKGTTSALIYEMLKTAGTDAYIGGNIGKPPISFLDTLTPQSIVVLEMSSFQLMDIRKSPQVAVMLMVTSEHLDYHATTEEYVDAKRNILNFQTADDMAILNSDYPSTRQSDKHTAGKVAWVSRYQPVKTGCFVDNNTVILRVNDAEEKVIDIEDILLPGGHNLENVCAAVMAAHFLGIGISDMQQVLETFKGLEHRLELVREVKGGRYYDDSFSTTPETAIAAILAFKDPKIVILGGSSKVADFTELGKVIGESSSIKALIGIGREWNAISSK